MASRWGATGGLLGLTTLTLSTLRTLGTSTIAGASTSMPTGNTLYGRVVSVLPEERLNSRAPVDIVSFANNNIGEFKIMFKGSNPCNFMSLVYIWTV